MPREPQLIWMSWHAGPHTRWGELKRPEMVARLWLFLRGPRTLLYLSSLSNSLCPGLYAADNVMGGCHMLYGALCNTSVNRCSTLPDTHAIGCVQLHLHISRLQ